MNVLRPRTVLACALILAGWSLARPASGAAPFFDPLAAADQTATAVKGRVTSRMTLTVPDPNTTLEIEGRPVPGSGPSRQYETPPLMAGVTYRYRVVATWQPNAYTTMTRTKIVAFRGGDPVTINLAVDDPADRVRVSYVPTPPEVVDEMIRVAGVGPDDIVFEPGCGDARITIAAVKAGARKGVGIDIDPDRVTDSRAGVKAAGLEGRVDIRQGDALDIPDLSTATVVFLYMGDHFNMLIRPNLWKQLKPGARVVSHRFTMGDWKPDRTVSVGAYDGSSYEVHLWTITEAVKRRMEREVLDRP